MLVSTLEWPEKKMKKDAHRHWDVYARDVAAIAVRASGSAITLDLPT